MEYKNKSKIILFFSFTAIAVILILNFALRLNFSDYTLYSLVFLLSLLVSYFINSLINRRVFRRLQWMEKRMKLWNNISYRVDIAGEEAFNEMPLAIVLFDENYTIEWANKYAKAIFMSPLINKELNFINQNLLKHLTNFDTVFNLELYGRTFKCDIRYDYRIMYLTDITNEVKVLEELENSRLTVGIINIDNLKGALSAFDAQERAQYNSDIIGILSDWAEENNIFLRAYSDERYLLLTNYLQLQILQRNGFKVIEQIKEYSLKENLRISLSIGIACIKGPKVDIVTAAERQLELALNRGGDQAIVLIDDEIYYYGARSNAIETRSSVYIRVKAEEIRDLIRASSDVYIMAHAHMDADAFGATIGMATISKFLGVETQIVFDSDSIDPTVNNIYEIIKKKHNNILDFFISPKEAANKITSESLLIIVDCQYKEILLSERVYNKASRIAIIDHHRRGPESIQDFLFLYSQPSASSTVELVTELLEYIDEDIEISSTIATWMLLGIMVDTNNFLYRTNSQTYHVLAKLNTFGADTALAQVYLREDIDMYAKKISVLNDLEIVEGKYGVAVCYDDIVSRQFLAKVADSIITINDIDAGFAIGYIDKGTVGISARSVGYVNVQTIMESLGGGGHFNNAATQIFDSTPEEAKETLIDKVHNISEGEGLTMKVILIKDVKGKGKVDDIIEVPAGHANFLIRSNQAVEATIDNIKQLENKKQKQAQAEEKQLEDMKKLKEDIESTSVTVHVRVGQEGKLFGTVSTTKVVDEFKNQNGIELDKRKIIYDGQIDSLGTYILPIQLHKEVLANITLYVVEKE